MFAACLLALCLGQQWSGTTSNYHGFVRHDFNIAGCAALIVEPKTPAKGNPWVWRMEFFDHRPEFDLAMLAKGYYLAYLNVGNTFGCPNAMDQFAAFHHELTANHNFNKRAILEGLSRGGLYAYNFAAKNPDKVMVLYGDAPVCDFTTWPYGGRGGARSDGDWKDLLNSYGFPNEQAALTYPFMPIDNLAPLAAAKIPIIHIVGDADELLPVSENTAVVERRYKALGGTMEVIHKPGGKHHPHALDDPTPLVQFMEKHFNDSAKALPAPRIPAPNPESRYDLAGWQGRSWLDQHNDCVQAASTLDPQVILIGDSITQGWGGEGRHVAAGIPDYWKTYLQPVHALNMGIAGDRVQNVLWRLQHGALTQSHPKIVELHIGTNNLASDDAPDIAKGIEDALKQIRKDAPQATVILIGLFPTGPNPQDLRRQRAMEVNRRIAKLANGKNVRFVDIDSELLKPDGTQDGDKMSSDTVHMVAGGYIVWGKALRAEIDRILGHAAQ